MRYLALMYNTVHDDLNLSQTHLTKKMKMNLRKYLKQEKISVEDFADKCKLSKVTIYNILNKKFPPRSTSAYLISQATKDQVTLKDLIYIRPKKKPKKLDVIKPEDYIATMPNEEKDGNPSLL